MSSTAATVRAARQEAPPSVRPTGWWGMVILIATEATLFAILISTYFYLRFTSDSGWPPHPLHDPKLVKPLIATVILVASSVPAALSARALRGGQQARARLALLVAVALGVVFLILQRQLVDSSLAQFRPGDHAYGSIFYTLIGLHAAHVVFGVLLGAFAVLRTVRLDRTAVVTVRITALYVHFVNVIAALVFLVLYLSPRG
jgi:heme/copper-type cytochrome/quinol oxidase subunit 3